VPPFVPLEKYFNCLFFIAGRNIADTQKMKLAVSCRLLGKTV
jgi:hypothetical protein